ncbi:MAG: isochorismate synthase [Bacteroidota bacterium]
MPFQSSNKLLGKAAKWLSNELPFVVYQNPNERVLQGIFQRDASLQIADDLKTAGFVFAPFEADDAKILTTGEYRKEKNPNIEITKCEGKVKFSDEGRDFHIKLVQDALGQIQKGKLRKVVLSKCVHVSTEQHPLYIFSTLLTKYPLAFCYWWYHPKVGMWFGATPEQLLQYQNGTVFTTSLAGTLPVEINKRPEWTSKELEEQQIVTDYIIQNLKGMVTNMKVSGPKTLKAGKLWHLKSVIAGNLSSFKDLAAIIERLHPTPAVCGLPRKDALEYILNHEGYQREYYTGYLGPVHLDKKEHVNLFVNLRCFKYSSGNAQVYVGGGITADSNPEEEWLETQYKSSTILEVL